MSTSNPVHPFDHAAVARAVDSISAALERVVAGFATLKAILTPETPPETEEFDPKDPANKQEIGGVMKLTPRGAEITYRLFDLGKSCYAVATAMGISYGAAAHRRGAWKKLGGVNRVKQPLT